MLYAVASFARSAITTFLRTIESEAFEVVKINNIDDIFICYIKVHYDDAIKFKNKIKNYNDNMPVDFQITLGLEKLIA